MINQNAYDIQTKRVDETVASLLAEIAQHQQNHDNRFPVSDLAHVETLLAKATKFLREINASNRTPQALRRPGEIEDLKKQWIGDPCWDIADTEGFEAHRDELQQFQDAQEAEWERSYIAKLEARAEELGVPGKTRLVEEIIKLEQKIARLASEEY